MCNFQNHFKKPLDFSNRCKFGLHIFLIHECYYWELIWFSLVLVETKSNIVTITKLTNSFRALVCYMCPYFHYIVLHSRSFHGISRNAPKKHWTCSGKTHIWKISNFWNEITEKIFFSVSSGLYFFYFCKNMNSLSLHFIFGW